MFSMVVTLEVSHCEISSLKEDAASLYESQSELAQNSSSKLVELEVSQAEICPYWDSTAVESESHSSTAPDRVESSNEDAKLEPLHA